MLACLAACSHVYSTGDRPDSGPKQDAPALHDGSGFGDAAGTDRDFVINTTYAGDQFLTNDFEAVGVQLAGANNMWTAVFRDTCTSCNIYGRRFDITGAPIVTPLAGNSGEFVASATPASNSSIPAVASTDAATIILWDGSASAGVSCRKLDNAGNALPETSITADAADVVTVTPLSTGNFLATWQTVISQNVVRATVVKPDCTALLPAFTVSSTSGTTGAHRAQAAANGGTVMYAWIVDGAVHVRTGLEDGTLAGADTTLLAKQATLDAAYVRIVPSGTGFALVVRWADPNGSLKGYIDLYQVAASGTLVGASGIIASSVGSDFASNKAFGLARAYDDLLMLVWHDCPAGPGSCDVFGALTYMGGSASSVFKVPYSSVGDQTNPSVIAMTDYYVITWTDAGARPPDTSGLAVRAQIMFVDRTLF